MKKTLILVTMMVASLGASAKLGDKIGSNQTDYENRHDVALSYGFYSNSGIISIFEDILTIAATVGHGYFDNEKFIGPISAEYFYRVNNWLGVGGIGAFATQGKDIMSEFSNEFSKTIKKEGSARLNYYTLMPALKADWLRRPHFGMYSKVGLGATIFTDSHKYDDGTKDSGSAVGFTWQASLLGLEAGSNNLRGFLEFSLLGEQGSIVVGLRHKF